VPTKIRKKPERQETGIKKQGLMPEAFILAESSCIN